MSKKIFDDISYECSELVTKRYSTSFSLGIQCFDKNLRKHIYSIYGFVRLADEIVDTFHQYEKKDLLNRFINETKKSIKEGISLNPILNSFQETVNIFEIDYSLINDFISSMKMDLDKIEYTQEKYEKYILGSAQVVGLMCLKLFCNGNNNEYLKLKDPAMKLGSAFQKVNFLRDLKSDFFEMGRTYFPNTDIKKFDNKTKNDIVNNIYEDFNNSFVGIKKLPKESKFGVYLTFIYYKSLLNKIKKTDASVLLNERIRVSNFQKFLLLIYSFVKFRINQI